MKLTSALLLGLSVSLLTPVCPARNIILFIGDGMGFEHVQAGRLYVKGSDGGGLWFELLPYHGRAVTTLPSGAVTDSATAGTALATGYQHPVNSTISTDTDGNPVETILERARDAGWRTGIITTDDIGGATPGAFGAHEPDRNLMTDIRADYLVPDFNHGPSLPNVLLGGGASAEYAAAATDVGYTVVATADALNELDLSSLLQPKLLGQFASTTLTREHDRLLGNSEPRLWEMVHRALELLSQNDSSFFLVVEGALIDKISHENYNASDDLCPEMAQLDLAFQEALAWVLNNGGLDNTLILVTADHETGGLNVPDGQSVGSGQQPSFTWSSTGHTAAEVPVYTSWPLSVEGARIDNTETFFVMEDWLAGALGQPPAIDGLAVESIKQTSASVTWTTSEPSVGQIACYDGEFLVASGSDTARLTVHRFNLTDLFPDRDYLVQVRSVDLAGFTGAADIVFRTASPNVDAYVQAEPQVALGAVVGTYTALNAPGDGQTQTITESTSGVGSGLDAIYTLHTSAAVNSILGATLHAGFTWTARDRGNDNVTLTVLNVQNGAWEPLSVNSGGSFQLARALDYIDDAGDLRVRFDDTALITREKKDVLTIDWLQADIEAGPPDTQAPSTPTGFGAVAPTGVELTAVLTWTPNTDTDLAGYWVLGDGWTDPVFTTQASYTDRVMAGGTYRYAVAAVDRSDNVSAYTSTVAIELVNSTAPSAPQNLQAQAGDRQVLLTWDKNPEWDVTGYRVYCLVEGVWTALDGGETVIGTSYLVTELVNGQTYRFSVTAVDSQWDGLLSAEVVATPSQTPKVWVGSISVSLQQTGKNWKATAVLHVVAEGQPGAEATVTGDWFFENQLLAGGVTGATDTTGTVSLSSAPMKTSSGTFTFRVTNVALTGYAYEPAGHATEGSATIGN